MLLRWGTGRGKRLIGGVALLAALFAGGFFAVGAVGRVSVDSPLIVIDQSIGGVSIGMSQADVEALFGQPESTLEIALRGGGTGLLVRYRVHGGLLTVVYAGGRVVSVETDSSFYRTDGGIGPGTSKAGLHGFGEDFCSGGLWDGSGAIPPDGVVTIFQRNGDIVASVTITQLGYYDLCASVPADQEVPDPRPGSFVLSVQIDPDGAGWVRSTPYKIDCPTKCSESFDQDAIVTLEAHPTFGFTFDRWTGACSGSGPCVLAIDGAKEVVAHFSGGYLPTPTTEPETTTATMMHLDGFVLSSRLSGRLARGAQALALALVVVAATGAQPAFGTYLVSRDVARPTLEVDAQGRALVTYSEKGKTKRLLVWGAVNALPPRAGGRQVAFHLDYSGGWKSLKKPNYYKTLKNVCSPARYDGPPLAFEVFACKAADGSYWALQRWQRMLPNLGFAPWRPEQSAQELYVSHWTGPLPELKVDAELGVGRALPADRRQPTPTPAARSTGSSRPRPACRSTPGDETSTSTHSTRHTAPGTSARTRSWPRGRTVGSATRSARGRRTPATRPRRPGRGTASATA